MQNRPRLLSPIPVSPPKACFAKSNDCSTRKSVAQPRAQLGKGEKNGSNVLGFSYTEPLKGMVSRKDGTNKLCGTARNNK